MSSETKTKAMESFCSSDSEEEVPNLEYERNPCPPPTETLELDPQRPPPTRSRSNEVTTSCQKDSCSSCDKEIDALPEFLNEYGLSHQSCLVCKKKLVSDRIQPSFDTVKVVKEICIKSILPDVTVQGGVLDTSYPFCEECTQDKINTLTHLYRQLLVLQESYDEIRFAIVAPIMTSFAQERKKKASKGHRARAGDQLFRYWRRHTSYPVREEDVGELTPQSESEGEEQDFPVNGRVKGGVGRSPNNWDSHLIPTSEDESSLPEKEFRIKSEPLDADLMDEEGGPSHDSCSFIGQKELLPVLTLEDFTSQTDAQSYGEEGLNSHLSNSNYSSSSESDSSKSSRHTSRNLKKLHKKMNNISKLLHANLMEKDARLDETDIHSRLGNVPNPTTRIIPKKRVFTRKLVSKNQLIGQKLIIRKSQLNSSKAASSPASYFSTAVKCEPEFFSPGSPNSTNDLNFSKQLPLTSNSGAPTGRNGTGRPLKSLKIKSAVTTSSGARKSLRAAFNQKKKKEQNKKSLLSKTDPPKRKRGRPSTRGKNESGIPKSKPKKCSSGRVKGRPRKSENNQDQGRESDDHDMDLFKCTPSIIEGEQLDVKILPFLHEEDLKTELPTSTKKSRGRGGGKKGRRSRSPSPHNSYADEDDYYDLAPPTPNYFQYEDQEQKQHEGRETIKRRFARDTPPRKINRSSLPTNSTKKLGDREIGLNFTKSSTQQNAPVNYKALEEAYRNNSRRENEDDSHDYAIGLDSKMGRKDNKMRKSVNKKEKQSSANEIKKSSGPKKQSKAKKASNSKTSAVSRLPVLKIRLTQAVIPKIEGTTPPENSFIPDGSSLPNERDEVDLSSPFHVSAFSDLLTRRVSSVVGNVDQSLSPSRRRSRVGGPGFYAQPYLEDGKEDEKEKSEQDLNVELDADVNEGEESSTSSSSGSNRPRVKKRLQKPRSPKKAKSSSTEPKPLRTRRRKFGPKKKRIKVSRMCSLCGKILVSDWNLTVHMRTHTGNRTIRCQVEGCGKLFFKPEGLNCHMRSHTKERPYKCEICACRFSYRVVLRTHKAAKHNIYDSEGVYECICGEKTIAETFLKKHFRSCERRRRKEGVGLGEMLPSLQDSFKVWCNYCEIQFENGESFKEHAAKDEKHIEIRIAKTVEARKELKEYNKIKKSKEEIGGGATATEEDETLRCRICLEMQVDHRLLQVHINKFHTWSASNTGSVNCEFCGKGFSTPGTLKTHMVLHSQDKPFVCKVDGCDYKSNTKVGLDLHKDRDHGGPPIPCPHCGKLLRKERALLRHLVTTHKDIHLKYKPHVCPSCYNNWATAQELQDHLVAEHMDVTCLTCGKIFGYRYDLNKHMKRVHNPADPMPPRKEGGGDDDDSGSGDEESIQQASIVKSRGRPRTRPIQGQRQPHSNTGRNFGHDTNPGPIFTDLRPSSSAGPSFHQVHGLVPLPLVSANFDQEYATAIRMNQQRLDAQIQNPLQHDFPHNFMYN